MPPSTTRQRAVKPEGLASLIYLVRGEKVILSGHLADLYGVPVKVLNQAVKRNGARFPGDFMFQLTPEEAAAIRASRSQIVTLKRGHSKNKMAILLKTSRSQVDRLLDAKKDITLSSLQRAAALVGRRVSIELV